MKVIVGLGNPEKKYDKTRHNVGFTVIDWLAEQANISFKDRSAFKSLVAETSIGGEKVLFVKPTTYYNNSGEAARSIMDFYKLNAEQFLIIHDELALPLGTVRLRVGGSDAGNNGVKSVTQHVGEATTRLRIGVASESHAERDHIDIVLGKFTRHEYKKLTEMRPSLITIIEAFIDDTHEVTTYKH
jgi:PTH1 family peptidyl-tRNA hydrolase